MITAREPAARLAFIGTGGKPMVANEIRNEAQNRVL
jgi:hypothetical protein